MNCWRYWPPNDRERVAAEKRPEDATAKATMKLTNGILNALWA
jgi:hypothetical protein